jgi:hypothetical protein
MFQGLLGEVRSGVIDRVFRYLPRPVAMSEAPAETAPQTASASVAEAAARAGRKRHKKR